MLASMAGNRLDHSQQAFFSGLFLGIAVATLGMLLAQSLLGPIVQRSFASEEEQILGDVHKRLVSDYVEPVDPSDLMRAGVRAMVEELDDGYTQYLGPELQRDYEEDSSGRLIGIGVQMAGLRVLYPTPGGPAERAGLRPGDTIVAVDGESVAGLEQMEVINRIKGKEGTTVHLQLQRHADQQVYDAELTRAPVPIGTVGRVEMLDQASKIGRLHIRSFARSTAKELDAALDELLEQGMRGLVIDLRYNRGGLLDSAVACASRFLDGGLICTLEGRGEDRDQRFADPELFRNLQLPIVVLTNRLSASGSEVLAAALRERGAAILVGTRSYGKGVYQQVQTYQKPNFTMKFTAGYYLTPAGRILEGGINPDYAGGLEPDISVPPLFGEAYGLLARWLGQAEVPQIYRDDVDSIWSDRDFESRPDDLAADTAVAALRQALARSTP